MPIAKRLAISDTTALVVRDTEGRLLGKTSEKFQSPRDSHGKILSINTPDAGLLFDDEDE